MQYISYEAAGAIFVDRMTLEGVARTDRWDKNLDDLRERHAFCCDIVDRDAFLKDLDARFPRWVRASRGGLSRRRS